MEELLQRILTELQHLRQDVDTLSNRLDMVATMTAKRFNQLEDRFNQLEDRFNRLEANTDERFNRLESATDERFNRLEDRLNRLESATDERFNRLEDRFNRLETGTEQRFDRLDARFDQLDKKVDNLTEEFHTFRRENERAHGIIEGKLDKLNVRVFELEGIVAQNVTEIKELQEEVFDL